MVFSSSIGQKRNFEVLATKKQVKFLWIITDFPQIGKLTDDINTRIKIVKDYLIIYEETETQIFILTIWDSRQDPEKLKKILE